MDFLDFISANFYTDEVSGGSQMKLSGTCPFCGESRDDLRLYVAVKNPHLGVCHHCGTGFSPLKFVAAYEQVSYAKAKDILYGDEDSFIRTEDESETIDMVFPNTAPIADYCAAKEYLEERNIDENIIKHFDLSYCIGNTDCPGYGEKEMLWTKSRVYIPIYDLEGRATAWQARDITGRSHMKYLFPPGFQGAKYVYNAVNIPYRPKYLILAEGVMDVFGWWRAGFTNVVATFGHKLSAEQADILIDLEPECLVVAWDDDSMALKYKLAEEWDHMFNIRIASMGSRDSDEQSKIELINIMKASKPYSWSDKILNSMN